MAVEAPKDPTITPAWARLAQHHTNLEETGISLKTWFQQDPSRVTNLSYDACGFHFDLSKNLCTPETIELLAELAQECGLEERRDAMLRGEHINTTENRAVLHTALRRPQSEAGTIMHGDQDVVADVNKTLERIYAFANSVRSGEWRGVTNKPIKTVVNIGIGGSDLGPAMAYEALRPYADAGLTARFVSNVDPNDLAEKTRDLDPETTLFIVVSKTFTTLETLTNAHEAKDWLIGNLRVSGAIPYTQEATKEAVAHHFVAVSIALDLVEQFGIDAKNTFGFWDWVGGRYSVSSAVGTILATVLGPDNFKEFLCGMHEMDEHFATAPITQNVPAIMGLLNVWYVNFFKTRSHAVLPYNQYLSRFPAYLQQLTMESNGKSVRADGHPVTCHTGEVFWGEPGTNGQHAFYQLLHQGTSLIPTDFIAFVKSANPVVEDGQDVQALLLSNFLAQTKALAFGKTADEVRAEGTPEEIVPARVFSGNRPSTSIFGVELNPFALGALIALYEHITFTQGVIWGIDSFDQWGVELGKQLAREIVPALSGDVEAIDAQDASTRSLIAFYAAHASTTPPSNPS